MMNPIQSNVKQIISKLLGVVPETINNESSFVGDLNANSLDMIEIIMAFEDNFEIDIDDDEAQRILTVQDAIILILMKTTNK